MEAIHGILYGFGVALQPMNLLACFTGVFIGTLIGVLPGLGPAAGTAILIPVTFYVVEKLGHRKDKGGHEPPKEPIAPHGGGAA
jgi:putative tricarboxylic transport membrane protein